MCRLDGVGWYIAFVAPIYICVYIVLFTEVYVAFVAFFAWGVSCAFERLTASLVAGASIMHVFFCSVYSIVCFIFTRVVHVKNEKS